MCCVNWPFGFGDLLDCTSCIQSLISFLNNILAVFSSQINICYFSQEFVIPNQEFGMDTFYFSKISLPKTAALIECPHAQFLLEIKVKKIILYSGEKQTHIRNYSMFKFCLKSSQL